MKEEPYIPQVTITEGLQLIDVPSAWKGLESILFSIIYRFGIKRDKALEFGVEYGYSTAALANYFKEVTGVDTFEGDTMTGQTKNFLDQTRANLVLFENISLVMADYRDFIKEHDSERWNLIHIDILHEFDPTYECGLWAVNHADIVIFHDTESFSFDGNDSLVKKALKQLAADTGKTFYNFTPFSGLGIIV